MKLADDDIIELSELASGAVDGRLTEAEATKLQEWLRSSEEAREFYVRFMATSAGISSAAAQSLAEGVSQDPKLENSTSWRPARTGWWREFRWRGWATQTAGFVLALGALAWALWLPTRNGQPSESPPAEATTTGVAVLAGAVGVTWSDSSFSVTSVGAVLKPGWLKLKSGLVQVDFFSGARVLLEGPSEFNLVSPTEAFCLSGKLSVEVPPQARGFRIGAPQTTVVDLGTAFGLDVSPESTELHVFNGEVEVHDNKNRVGMVELREGQGLAVYPSGERAPFSARPDSFASVEEFHHQSREALQRRYAEWQSASVKFNADPSLLVRFDFESMPRTRLLSNVAPLAPAPSDGTIVGCGWTQGRWLGKGALDFKNVSDRVRFSVGAEFEAITLMAWVRVDGIQHLLNALMNCDGFDPGGFHWQIRDTGNMAFSVKAPGNPSGTNGVIYLSPVIFTPERLGQWAHLAVTYNRPGKKISFYADGSLVSEQSLELDLPLRIKNAELGNWNSYPHIPYNTPIRNLNGRMDEFALFAEALSPHAIQEAFQFGRPQSEFLGQPGRPPARSTAKSVTPKDWRQNAWIHSRIKPQQKLASIAP